MSHSSIRGASGAGLLLLLAGLLPGCARPVQTLEPVQGVVVKFAEGLEVSAQERRFLVKAGPSSRLDEESVAAARDALDATMFSVRVREIRRVFDESGPRQVDGRDLLLYYEIRVKRTADAPRLLQGLQVNPLVEEARLHPLGMPIPRPVENPEESSPAP